eukprot:5965050-Ditylum_brightwellii.AAC.1
MLSVRAMSHIFKKAWRNSSTLPWGQPESIKDIVTLQPCLLWAEEIDGAVCKLVAHLLKLLVVVSFDAIRIKTETTKGVDLCHQSSLSKTALVLIVPPDLT